MILANLCNKNPSLKLVNYFLNPETALQFLEKKEETIDLLFLDIEMPIMNGLQFLDKLTAPPMVIFTTADPMYAFEAFEHQAIDFLIKPISSSRFEQAVEKAMRASTIDNKVNEIIASARKLQEEKRSLVSLLAHDLRNPLFSLQIKAAQLKMSQPQDKLATDIETAISQIHRITTQILEIEQTENLEIYKTIAPVAIKPLIDTVLSHLEIRSISKKLKIGINETVPNTMVLAESSLLEHILENILSNAIKFSPMHGKIEIYIEEIDGVIKVRIEDDGPGISPEKRADLFHKKSLGINANDDGLGIGLSLSKKFADLMNIRLGIHNSGTVGTTAYLEIEQSLS